jgi:predicted Zn finger-like uncharacterized protein
MRNSRRASLRVPNLQLIIDDLIFCPSFLARIIAMQTQVQCPSCFAAFSVPSNAVGKLAKCTKCGEQFKLIEAARSVKAEPQGVVGTPSGSSDRRIDSFYGENATLRPPPLPAPPLRADVSPVVTMVRESETRSSVRQFWALRAVARLYEILVIVLGVVSAIVVLVSIGLLIRDQINGETELGVASWFIGNLIALLYALLVMTGLYFVAQIIRLALQIEQNTLETRDACVRMAADFRENASQIRHV